MTRPSSPPPVALADYERLALERMTARAEAYVNGGAADEITLRENRAAFDRLRLTSAVLRDLSGATTRTRLLGLELDHPILLAPVAFQKLVHPEGEIAAIQGAGAARAAAVVSTQASIALEDIAAAASTPLWFQLYIQPDRPFTRDLVARAVAAGYRALVVTVDAPASLRNREQRAGFHLPPGVEAVNLKGMAARRDAPAAVGDSPLFSGFLSGAPTWDDLAWLRGLSDLPIVLKGILAPGDARRAVEAGAQGLIVSNHGGRILDTLPATIDALPAIADATRGEIPLLLDGGIRRGTDIVKALARGATAVLIGRPYVHALAAAGAVGVAHAVHLLRAELEVAMAVTGCARLDEIDGSVLWTA
ncbi:alpha-hydroxy acid oxidase [Aquabacter spiritensis]|uniref:4-hydroxymandelate oxidase n=1 Tax=Aquabacter spiritensis TaxID=933073 RepID=A0A4R3LUP7_9HYPH|nr:alpha-hydroxy acid oxidase [Aquabacter spiritensis]TCT02385.1 4-hydroxymandelate oxidase [Aquabacter spiritensis]